MNTREKALRIRIFRKGRVSPSLQTSSVKATGTAEDRGADDHLHEIAGPKLDHKGLERVADDVSRIVRDRYRPVEVAANSLDRRVMLLISHHALGSVMSRSCRNEVSCFTISFLLTS